MSGEDGSSRRPLVAGGAGFGGGFVSGLLGGGGGSIMVPLMTGPLRMSQHTAHGTSLLVITGAAAVAAIAYSFTEGVSPQLVLALGAGAALGAIAGARLASRLPAIRLRQIFGVFLFLVALRLLVWESVEPLFATSGAAEFLAGAGLGIAGGVVSGALGVGGGSIFVPGLVLGLGMGQHEAQGISLWVVVISAIAGAVAHNRQGTVDMRAARWLAPAAVPGAIGGAVVAAFLSGRALQLVFAVLLVAIGVQMFSSAQRALRAEGRERIALAADAT